MNHTLFEQNGQHMTERSTQSTMVSPHRPWAITARQVFIEKLLDLERVKLFGRQATQRHPSGKVGQPGEAACRIGGGITTKSEMRAIRLKVRRKRAIE